MTDNSTQSSTTSSITSSTRKPFSILSTEPTVKYGDQIVLYASPENLV